MKIVVKRVEYKTEEKKEKIAFQKEEVVSDALTGGASELTQKGEDGEKTVTYKVKYVDGKEDSREKVEEKVTKEPVTQIVTKGSASSTENTEVRFPYESIRARKLSELTGGAEPSELRAGEAPRKDRSIQAELS